MINKPLNLLVVSIVEPTLTLTYKSKRNILIWRNLFLGNTTKEYVMKKFNLTDASVNNIFRRCSSRVAIILEKINNNTIN